MSTLSVIVGQKGTGKSTLIANMAVHLRKKTLIIDPGAARVYKERGFSSIKKEHAYRHKKGIATISEEINNKQTVELVFGYDAETKKMYRKWAFRDGNLFCEDAASYINHHTTEKVLYALKAMKQYGLNLFLSYHRISEIPDDLLSLSVDKVIFLKSGDTQKVFGKIKKAESFTKYRTAKIAFYKAQYFGMKPSEIEEEHYSFLKEIARDLVGYIGKDKVDWTGLTREEIAVKLAQLANKTKTGIPTEKQIAAAKYTPFAVTLNN